MQILAHRGFWKSPAEKNTPAALERAFRAGYGIETDIRDQDGELVISHDVPTAAALRLSTVLEMYVRAGSQGTLALNVKSDGLQQLLARALSEHAVTQYFVFDMSVPEMVRYRSCGMRLFSRMSEYEMSPSLSDVAAGIWLDGFQATWYTWETVRQLLSGGQQVAVVSPELHGRPHRELWQMLRRHDANLDQVLLCTDFPDAAVQFFAGSAKAVAQAAF